MLPILASRRLNQQRTLFKSIKQKSKELKQLNQKNSEDFHHEYSIRPDTFAFKVSASNEKSRSLVKRDPDAPQQGSKPHPFQNTATYGETEPFNLVKFIYTHATNYPFDTKSPQEVFNEYPQTNSAKLARFKHRPSKVKMLASDFIEDSLYNPHYGYFSKEVEIFKPEKPFDYNNIDDIDDFMDHWQKSYSRYDEAIDPKIAKTKEQVNDLMLEKQEEIKGMFKSKATAQNASPNIGKGFSASSSSKFASRAKNLYTEELQRVHQPIPKKRSLQLWHTPTELFQPYYGEALARYLLVNYKLSGSYPYEDLVIYEMGGGNGTLMCNILNYIKNEEPDVYARTRYKIIEISSQLAEKQMRSALKDKLIEQGLDSRKLEIINKSIFKWDKVVQEPCYFIALEVFDNFAHDVIRYDNITGEPYECQVLVDEHGDFYEFYTPKLSYYSNALLQLRENGPSSVLKKSQILHGGIETLKSIIPFTNKDKIHPLHHSSLKLRWKNSILPFKDDLTPGEFIPTRLLEFFQILKHRFPNHSLITSDFNSLPKTIGGYYNAPVVQTVLQDKMIDVSTYMCHQGYFDIMFPTDFKLASNLYSQVTGKTPRVESHKDFLEQWADVNITTTKTGENPMLDFYQNVSFMVS